MEPHEIMAEIVKRLKAEFGGVAEWTVIPKSGIYKITWSNNGAYANYALSRLEVESVKVPDALISKTVIAFRAFVDAYENNRRPVARRWLDDLK